MPRTNGVYKLPSGSKAIPNTTVRSAPYNAVLDDLASDANDPRPITAGGTGASNATKARENLGALAAADILASPQKATPIDGDGVVITDSADSGKLKRVLWSRVKAVLKAYFDGLYLNLAGGTLTGLLTTRSDTDSRIELPGQGNLPLMELNYSSVGNLGFYDRTNKKWVLRVDINGVLRDIAIPADRLQPNPVFTGNILGLDFENGAIRFTTNAAANFLQTGTNLSASYRPLHITQMNSATPIASFLDTGFDVTKDFRFGGAIRNLAGGYVLGGTGYLEGSYWEQFGNKNARLCIWNRIDAQGALFQAAAEAWAKTYTDGKKWAASDITSGVFADARIPTMAPAKVGLGNVNNTSDAAKPVSTATQAALNGKANTSHTHTAAQTTSGVFAIARIPALNYAPPPSTSTSSATTDFPIGTTVLAHCQSARNRGESNNLYKAQSNNSSGIPTNTSSFTTNSSPGSSNMLSGTWLCRGSYQFTAGIRDDFFALYERVS